MTDIVVIPEWIDLYTRHNRMGMYIPANEYLGAFNFESGPK